MDRGNILLLMTLKKIIIAIAVIVVAVTAITTALVITASNDGKLSQQNEEGQFASVNDAKRKETASGETDSTGSMANVLLFADGTIVSLNKDSETAGIEIATPGYGLSSGNVYTFGFSERLEQRLISFEDLNIGDFVRVEYMYFLDKSETLHGEYIVKGSVETRPSAQT